MSPEAIIALANVASDLVKIVGPALVAALATYKAAQMQFTAKLKELESGGELKARESLFSYYRERGEYLRSTTKELAHELGKLYGQLSGSDSDTYPDDRELLEFFGKFLGVISNMIPHEVMITQAEMESIGLEKLLQYSKLKDLVERHQWSIPTTTKEEVLGRFEGIMEIYSYLMHCNQIILETRIREVFKPYLESTRRA